MSDMTARAGMCQTYVSTPGLLLSIHHVLSPPDTRHQVPQPLALPTYLAYLRPPRGCPACVNRMPATAGPDTDSCRAHIVEWS
jgi:hypothetical protein